MYTTASVEAILTYSIFLNRVYVIVFQGVKLFIEIHLSLMTQSSFERPNLTSKT